MLKSKSTDIAVGLLSIAILTTSCTNFGRNRNFNPTGFPGSDVTNQTFPITLTKVVKVPNRDNEVNLVGDGSGQIGQFCGGVDGNPFASGYGPSNCTCTFTYTREGGITEEIEQPTIYFDSTSLRCALTNVPADAVSLTASIRASGSAQSNPLTVNINEGSFGAFLDFAAGSSFIAAKRFQCRDIVTIQHMYDPGAGDNANNAFAIPGIYDPFQSESVRYSYPLNYYTRNIGESMRQFFNASSDGDGTEFEFSKFQCSFNPTLPEWWEHKKIYSVGALNGNSLIAPYNGGFDRETFYLAKSSSGAYNTPINVLVAPGRNTQVLEDGAQSTFAEPLGFGAQPITTGPNRETCPEDLPRPEGWEVVKVFPFRGSLTKRQFVATVNHVSDHPGVACDTGAIPNDPNFGEAAFFADCAVDPDEDTAPFSLHPLSGADEGGAPAGRVFLFNVGQNPATPPTLMPCARFPDLNNDGIFNPGIGASEGHPAGVDIFERIGNAISIENFQGPNTMWNVGTPVDGGRDGDVQGVWQGFGLDEGGGTASLPNGGDLSTLKATSADMTILDIDEASRSDYVFVVTPNSVNTESLRLNGDPALGDKYSPFIFHNRDDCNANSLSECNTALGIRYNLFRKDITTPIPAGTDPNSLGEEIPDIYPICAVRPPRG